MEQLNAEIEDTVMLASRNGLSAQYIHIVQARTAIRLHLTPGTMRPIAKSVTGWVMLSKMSDVEVAKLVRRHNSEVGSLDEVINFNEFLHKIAAIRRDGYALSHSQITPGCSVLAMPLPSQLSETPLVIGIGGVMGRIDERRDELVALLSQRIREHLGG